MKMLANIILFVIVLGISLHQSPPFVPEILARLLRQQLYQHRLHQLNNEKKQEVMHVRNVYLFLCIFFSYQLQTCWRSEEVSYLLDRLDH